MKPSALTQQLTSCDREPINTPGAIQGHGVLLTVHKANQTIQEASANADEVFGQPAQALLGRPLRPLLGDKASGRLARHVARGLWNALQPITLTVPSTDSERSGRRWHVFVHRQGDVLVLEFELATPARQGARYYRYLRSTLGAIHGAGTLSQMCRRTAIAVRQITRYDLVMIYRFDADWNGEVVAESRHREAPTYLHHNFPSSDIPQQARDAFRNTWVRTIPDVHYEPVPLLKVKGRAALNLAGAQLRSVSPIHIQYLKNMGTEATLTISLVRDGKLWGLVACHHGRPAPLCHEARLACELIGKTVSSLIEARQRSDAEASDRALSGKRSRLLQGIEQGAEVRQGLQDNASRLLEAVDADGGAVCIDENKNWMLLGRAPARKQVASLANWLEQHMGDAPVFSTAHLAAQYPRAKDMRQQACGLLAVSIPKAKRNFIMWFRPEEAQTKVWAGNPDKQVTRLPDGTVKIEPRQSFEGWKQAVTLRARPWTQAEISSALAVRNDLMALDLQRQFATAQQAIRARDEFLSIASHELKTPLTTMRLQTQMTRRRIDQGQLSAERLQQAMGRIDEGINRLVRLVDDMLDISRISTGKLAISPTEVELTALARDVTERMRGQFDLSNVKLELTTEAPAKGLWDPLRIEQVLWNLLSNALRYGRGSPVYVRAGLHQGRAVLEVEDEGPGIAPESQARIFDKFERADVEKEAFGLGLGLHICKSIVELHGGQIELHSEKDAGTVFSVTLPVQD